MGPLPVCTPLDVFNSITGIFISFPEKGLVEARPGKGDKGPPLLTGARLPAAITEAPGTFLTPSDPPP